MKQLIFILTLLLLIPLVQADEVYNKWHRSDDTFLFEGDIIDLRMSSNLESMKIQVNQDSKIFREGDCKEFENHEVCFEETTLDLDVANIGSDGKLYPGVRIYIEKFVDEQDNATNENDDLDFGLLEGNLEYEVVYEKNLMVGESSDIIVYLNNTGEGELFDISAELGFPESFDLQRKSLIRLDNAFLTSPRRISPGGSQNFDGAFIPTNAGEYEIQVQIIEGQDILEFYLPVDVEPPFSFTQNVEPSNDDGLTFNAFFSLENKGDEDLQIDEFKVNYDDELTANPSDDFDFNALSIVASNIGVLPSKEIVNLSASFSPSSSGTYQIYPVVDYTYNGESFTYESNESFTVSQEPVEIDVQISSEVALPGSTIDYNIDVISKTDDVDFNDLNIVLRNEFFDEVINMDVLEAGSSHSFSGEFEVPRVYSNLDEPITLSASYLDAQDTQNSIVKEFPFKLRGDDRLFDIVVNTDESNFPLSPGDELTVEVEINNLLDMSFDKIDVYDNLSFNRELVAGEMQNAVSIEPNDNAKAYLYKVVIPNNYSYDGILIETVLNATEIGYFQTEATLVSIQGDNLSELQAIQNSSFNFSNKEMPSNDSSQSSNNESNSQQSGEVNEDESSNEEDQKEGFFSRFLSFFFG